MSSTRLGIKLWIEGDEGAMLGTGRMELLRLVEELGSLNKAAKELGMSYRQAWGRVQATEQRLGEPIVVRGRGRGGYALTDFGRSLLETWDEYQRDVSDYAERRADELLPWSVRLRGRES
ncbi:MAG: winged helix-turn-helix domain-containing protein [Desulfovibrionaceae bacterium]